MIAQPHFNYLSPQEYLDWEANQELKHEYIDGEAFAMTGGNIPHNDIALNLYSLLRSHLRGKGCRVNVADVKVNVSQAGSYHYPDLVVSCDERVGEASAMQNRAAIQFIQYPCLIVEVLSPSTEAFDRGEKFRRYRQLPSLQEYLLIDSSQINIDRFSRLSDNKWELQSYSNSDVLELTSINWQGAIALLYEDVSFEVREPLQEKPLS